ncbi:PAS domain-containing protein [Haloplanus ruber]|uniref:histidine kinase n=1 Tax=Haloplanus ruber TaxID=869892 RepID=A0ABD6CZY1_9EURY
MTQTVRVLHVDDDTQLGKLTATFLEREDDRFAVQTATSVAEAIDRIRSQPPDCVVSDYDMPGANGIEFLRRVRDEWPELPFILFTGKGSEEVASEAIAHGATDYLQKGKGTDQYELLANRIGNAVSQYRSETRLRETREEYATVFESALVGLLLVDVERDGFRYQRCNPQALELIGRDRTGIVGHTPCEVFGPEDGRKIRGAYRTCVERGEPLEYTVDLELPAGQVARPGKVAPVVLDGEIEQLVVSFYDITEKRWQKEQLERQNDLFRKAQDIADIGAWEYDILEDRITWTDQVYEIYDRPPEAPADTEAVVDLHHPDDRETLREACTDAVETGEPYDLELRLQPADGETRWVSVHGQPQTEDGELVRVRGTIQDVTESKRRVEEILELSRQYRTLSENIPNGAVFLFDDDLRYVRARGPELDAVGLSPDDVEGTTPHDVFPDALAEELAHYFTEALNGRSHTFTQTLGDRTYRNRTVPVETGGGAITHGIALTQNVTEQVERRQELETQNERLEEFTDVVTHDLRNPLQAATGRLELAQAEDDSTHLSAAADALDRSQALIDDLSTLAQCGDTVGSTEPLSVPAQAEECWQMVPSDDATLAVESDRTIRADRSRFRQVLENLFANAVEHGGAEVTVSVGDLPDGFYVADDGVGIPENEREEVFEAGYSTTTDGTGLGLRIVKRIVDGHGWKVAVTDSDGGGTRVEITGVDTA